MFYPHEKWDLNIVLKEELQMLRTTIIFDSI